MNKRPSFLRPAVLCVLDGWGYSENADGNATVRANAPVFWKYWDSCPHALLDASGEAVGLPAGQMGNSEVGHMNLGAGRVVLQDLPRIDRAIEKKELENNPALNDLIDKLKKGGGVCHLMGLASPGGVHSHQRHIIALAEKVAAKGVPVAVHAFLDGRDVPPQSAAEQINGIAETLSKIGGVMLASLCGRYYAMDRDNRWERIEKAYDLLTMGKGVCAADPVEAVEDCYKSGVTDEFVPPIVLKDYRGMNGGDGILFANFRADRAREILFALLDPAFAAFPRKKTVSFAAAAGMVEYSERLDLFMTTLFPPQQIKNGLGEIIAQAGLRQLRIAETEKYPHVTFFFNGGREEPYENESRIMIPSPKVATYDLKPEMSAREVTDKVVEAIASEAFDFIVINYANPDMVGHTGIMPAAVRAVRIVDECLDRLFSAVKVAGGFVFLTSDHGNCESMQDYSTNGPHTSHTISPVPAMIVNSPVPVMKMRPGKLADVAPTVLDLMGLPQPVEMDGKSLITK